MSLKYGIVGLPNVGKSTIFNALTNLNVETKNFPFCTIKPNNGITFVPDDRLEQLNKIIFSKNIVPTTIEFIDIAGLVKGASKGQGLGNQFLSNISEVDAIIHVVRCFKKNNIAHISGKIDPKSDIETINIELCLSDLNICEKYLMRLENKIKILYKEIENKEYQILKKCFKYLSEGKFLSKLQLKIEEKNLIKNLNFLTLKPMMYVANIDKCDHTEKKYLNIPKNFIEEPNSAITYLCAIEKEKIFTIQKNKKNFGLEAVIKNAYAILNLKTYFTVGKKEIRAWTISSGTTALDASKKIHTDFKKGFISAKTISFEDYVKFQGEKNAKKAGKVRLEGKNYIVQDGDIIEFFFNI